MPKPPPRQFGTTSRTTSSRNSNSNSSRNAAPPARNSDTGSSRRPVAVAVLARPVGGVGGPHVEAARHAQAAADAGRLATFHSERAAALSKAAQRQAPRRPK
jgi:hypothetical protein